MADTHTESRVRTELIAKALPYREDFPIFRNLPELVYLDNAATIQKPQSVIDQITKYYEFHNANVHRGNYRLSEEATELYENARKKLHHFLNTKSEKEIIFVRGTTEAINLVASSFGGCRLKEGDEVLVSGMEHHSDIVPWQMACQKVGAVLKVIPVLKDGSLDINSLDSLLTEKTKMVSVVHVSNSLGTVNPVKEIIRMARKKNIPVLVDGAQSGVHLKIDVQDLDCDFYTLSAHKMFGPTGIGVLYGKESHLVEMPPYQGGGDMIESVSFENTTYAGLPNKFEAGTPNICGAVAFGAAIDYINKLDRDLIANYEDELLNYLEAGLTQIPGIRLIGTSRPKISVQSFIVKNIHPFDLGTLLDRQNIATRTGNHCTEPLMKHLETPGTIRASLCLYNTKEEVDKLIQSLKKAVEILG